MRTLAITAAGLLSLALAWSSGVSLADGATLKDATGQVESGAKTIGRGIEDTAKGVGHTVSEGAKTAGETLKEAGKAAEPQARTAWQQVRGGAVAFGRSVRDFFTTLVRH
jgi:hypothetical protein